MQGLEPSVKGVRTGHSGVSVWLTRPACVLPESSLICFRHIGVATMFCIYRTCKKLCKCVHGVRECNLCAACRLCGRHVRECHASESYQICCVWHAIAAHHAGPRPGPNSNSLYSCTCVRLILTGSYTVLSQ